MSRRALIFLARVLCPCRERFRDSRGHDLLLSRERPRAGGPGPDSPDPRARSATGLDGERAEAEIPGASCAALESFVLARRRARIASMRARVRAGYYDRPDVRAQIVGVLTEYLRVP